MPVRDIVTIVDLSGTRPAASAAAELARRLDAHLTGLTLAFNPILPGSGIGVGSELIYAQLRDSWLAHAREADAAFQEVGRLAGIRQESVILDTPSGGYLTGLLRYTRLTDLVVIGQDNPEAPEPMREALIESLLFDGGAPVLMVPYIGADSAKFRRALIAWDGSATAARAIRAALPLLATTERVTVLQVGKRGPEDATDLAVYLDRHGLKVEVEQVPRAGVAVADVILNTAFDRGFDWVVMGAYGHSRTRESLFGGATRDILKEMTVPILMTH